MGDKILLDANVLLDFLLIRHESAEDTAKIIRRIEGGYLNGYLTLSIVQILGYWLAKEWKHQKAKDGLAVLLNHFDILDGNKPVVRAALSSHMTDIEDALQYYTAIHHDVDLIISRDKQFKKNALPVLPIYTPEEFVKDFM